MAFDGRAARSHDILPLTLEGVTFGAGAREDGAGLIDGLDLTVEAGAPTVLLGPNGAGKSLTLRLIQGLLTPGAGRIAFAGRPADAELRRRVALVFQRPVLLRRSLRANLDHALKAYGAPRSRRAERIEQLLETAGLTALALRPARVLSGGEQQRAALVRALAAAPQLLLLDEPTASLDPQSTHAVESLIAQAVRDGVKVLLVTHDLGQARRIAGEVVFLHRGRALERAPAEAFFVTPASAEARAYLEGRLLI